MKIETKVTITVTITVGAEDVRCCALTCAYRRAGRCGLYRKDLAFGRRVAECLRDTPIADCPDLPEFAHVRDPRLFSLPQLADLAAQDNLGDAGVRGVLALKWKDQDRIPVRRSFAASDTDVHGYGPTDRNGFFYYPVSSVR